MPLELNFQYFAGNSANIPLIVLHGLFGSTTNWRTLCKRYAGQRDVYALDLRNHGQSPHHPRMSIEDMAGDVLAFLDGQQLAGCDLLGHSMGGKVAMQLALEMPERVERLIVADIAPRHYPPRHNDVFAAIEIIEQHRITNRNQADKLIEDVLPDQATRLFLLTNLARISHHPSTATADPSAMAGRTPSGQLDVVSTTPAPSSSPCAPPQRRLDTLATKGGEKSGQARDDHGEYRWRIDVQAIRDNYEIISDAPPAAKSGKQFTKPALFVRGGKSFYIQPEDGGLIASLFPNAAIEEIPDAGHWVHAEQPEAFFQITQRFLDG